LPAPTHAIAVSIGVAPVGAVLGIGTLGDVFDDVCGGWEDALGVFGEMGVSVGCAVGPDEHAETPPVSSTAAAVRTAIRMPP